MSFYRLPHPWNPGYAIPKYVMAEPPERGTFTTQWLPRGTIPQLIPDFLAQPDRPGRKLLGRRDAGLGSLSGTSLSGTTLGGGHTLAKSTLAGSSLGADEYTLVPIGATAPAPAGFPIGKLALAAGAVVGAVLLAKKLRK